MDKYLRLYAEPETTALGGLVEAARQNAEWANVVVIPACNESAEFLRPPPPGTGRSLMILVINETDTAHERVSLNNRALAAEVRMRFESVWESAEDGAGFKLTLFRDEPANRDVLLVDRFGKDRKLPIKGGVGHARKIGADVAAWLIHRQHIKSPWIHCTDADVRLPETYFNCSNAWLDAGPEYAALVYPFRHCGLEGFSEPDEVIRATHLYELSLHYYVAGLKFAGSPYAFHTIGSTMAVNAKHYAKVRGFPKREAGEDFYLLNKLAKVGPVLELSASADCRPIEIAARRSDRVPFGTGAAVNTISSLNDPLQEFRFYNPRVFELLQDWLKSWPVLWSSGSSDLQQYQPGLLAGLKAMGAEKALVHAFTHSKDLGQFTRQMHTWFDAFRTLKLIHFLRDEFFPSVDYDQLREHPVYGELFTVTKRL